MRLLLILFTFLLTDNILNAQDLTADFSYFPRTQFNAVVVHNDTSETGIIFEKIVIEGYDSRFPFYYIRPEKNPDNRCVILLHGASSNKDFWVYARNKESSKFTRLKDSLLSLGIALIIPDMKYSGERSYEIDFATKGSLLASNQFQKFSDFFTSTVKDIRIIMDYIESRSSLTSLHFNIIGWSLGSVPTILLNSVDERLQSVVVCVAPLVLVKMIERRGLKGTEAGDKLASVLDLFRYAKSQKSPVCLLMANADIYYTEQEARDFNDQIPVEGKAFKIYESGHQLPDFFIEDVIEFLM